MDGVANVSRAHVAGTLSGISLTFSSNLTQPDPSAIGFVGTITEHTIIGTIHHGSTSWQIRLQQSSSALSDFDADISRLAARAKSAHVVLESAVSRLDTRVGQLDKAAAALGTDTSTMDTYFADEVRDVKAARTDANSTLVKASASPAPSRSKTCASVSKTVAGVEVVAHDADFLAGFIYGLQGSINGVSTLASSLTFSAQHLGLNIASLRSFTPSLSGARSLAFGVSSAHAVAMSSQAHVGRIASAADRYLTGIYATTNAMLATTGCHRQLVEVSPFRITAAA